MWNAFSWLRTQSVVGCHELHIPQDKELPEDAQRCIINKDWMNVMYKASKNYELKTVC